MERMKVLVADDDWDTRQWLTEMLEHFGHPVVTADNGVIALEMLRSEEPPIALIDWNMPEMQGIEVVRQARLDPELEGRYLILVTGRTEPADLVQGLEAGADDYLTKPVASEELRSRLRVGERVVGLQARLAERVRELKTALATVDRLEGLVPICAHCKSVRNERDYWERVEQFVESRTSARFTHGICPTCLAKLEKEAGW